MILMLGGFYPETAHCYFLYIQRILSQKKKRLTSNGSKPSPLVGGDKRDRTADLLNAIAPEEVTYWKNIDKTDVFDV